MTNNDPIKSLCNAAMQAVANASRRAMPGSPFATAKATLGDKWTDVAVEAMRVSMKREFFALCDQAKQDGPGFQLPHLAEHTLIATVVADATAAVVEAASAA